MIFFPGASSNFRVSVNDFHDCFFIKKNENHQNKRICAELMIKEIYIKDTYKAML